MEPLHVAALIPAFALVARGPVRLPGAFMLLALAFAASWVSDSVSFFLGNSWAGDYIVVPVQIGLVLMAVTEHRLLALGLLACLALLSAALTFPGPEVLVMTVGSGAIVLLVKGSLSWPVWLYFGLGTALYLLMVGSGDFGTYWYGYQVCRLGAFATFVALLWRDHAGHLD